MHFREACPICGGYEGDCVGTHDRSGRPLLMLLCRGCGLLQAEEADTVLPPRTQPGRIDFWYEGLQAARIAALLRSTVNVGAFGCDAAAGHGVLMYVLKRAGFGMVGAADSTDAVAYAKQALGVSPEAVTWEKMRCSDSSFDFLVLSQLHRNADPLTALIKAYTKLRSDGILCVSVPDAASLLRCHKGRGRFEGYTPFAFSGLTLRALAYKAGFMPLDADTHGTDVLFRKTHPPIPDRAIALNEHAGFMHTCALGHKGERIRYRWGQAKRAVRAGAVALWAVFSGASSGDIIIRAVDYVGRKG